MQRFPTDVAHPPTVMPDTSPLTPGTIRLPRSACPSPVSLPCTPTRPTARKRPRPAPKTSSLPTRPLSHDSSEEEEQTDRPVPSDFKLELPSSRAWDALVFEINERGPHPNMIKHLGLSRANLNYYAPILFRNLDLPSFMFPHEQPGFETVMFPLFPPLESPMPDRPPSRVRLRLYEYVTVAQILRHGECEAIAREHPLPNLATVHAVGSHKLCTRQPETKAVCHLLPNDPAKPIRLVLTHLCPSFICQQHTDRRLLTRSVESIVLDLSTIRDLQASCLSMKPIKAFKPNCLVFLVEGGGGEYELGGSPPVNAMSQRIPSRESRPCNNLYYRMAMVCLQMPPSCQISIVMDDLSEFNDVNVTKVEATASRRDIVVTADRMFRLKQALELDKHDPPRSSASITSHAGSPVPDPSAQRSTSNESTSARAKRLLICWIEDCLDPRPRAEKRRPKPTHAARSLTRYSAKAVLQDEIARRTRHLAESIDEVDSKHLKLVKELVQEHPQLRAGASSEEALRASLVRRIRVMSLDEYRIEVKNMDETLFERTQLDVIISRLNSRA